MFLSVLLDPSLFLLDLYFRDAMSVILRIFRDYSLVESGPVLMNEPVGIDQISDTKLSSQQCQSERYFPAFKLCNLTDVEYFRFAHNILLWQHYLLPLWNTSTFVLILNCLISVKWSVAQEQVVIKSG